MKERHMTAEAVPLPLEPEALVVGEGEPDALYTAEELTECAETAFDVRPEVMAGALHLAGKETMTRKQAQLAITAFLTRKV